MAAGDGDAFSVGDALHESPAAIGDVGEVRIFEGDLAHAVGNSDLSMVL
jgi:hypothetical protein